MSGAVDWLRVSHTLVADPKLLRMSIACKVSRTAILGACVHVWSLADMTTTDGFLSGADRETIDAEVGIAGFVAAMEAIGWAEVRPDGVLLVGFVEKNGGWTSKGRRVDAARRAAESRTKNKHRDDLVTNAHESARLRTNAHTPSMSMSSLVSVSTSPEGESEGKPVRTEYDCWDGVKRSHIFRAYPELGRKQPAPAQDAIGNAAEWIVENRPDLGDPLAFLMDRVKAYAKSPEGSGRYVPNCTRWMQDRRFMEGEASWARGDGITRQASAEDINRAVEELNGTGNGKARGRAVR